MLDLLPPDIRSAVDHVLAQYRPAPGSASARWHNGKKTHCIRGHEYAGDNLIVTGQGKRRCRTCSNLLQRLQYEKRSADRTVQRRRKKEA
jgi:hypothetical protein